MFNLLLFICIVYEIGFFVWPRKCNSSNMICCKVNLKEVARVANKSPQLLKILYFDIILTLKLGNTLSCVVFR